MEKKYATTATTVRLDGETYAMIAALMEQTGAKQSQVLRHLINTALGRKETLAVRQVVDLPEDVKKELFFISNELADIKMQLSRIGNNINLRRKKYNGDRKAITDKISSLQRMKKHDGTYDRIRHEEEIKKLRQNLNEFDSSATSMVVDDEWTKFQELLQKYEEISIEIGEKLYGYTNIPK